jgi:hypothetical protein
MVTYRADPAKTLDQNRGFPIRTALDEPLKSAEFDNMEPGSGNIIMIIQVNGHFSMSFNPGYWFYRDFLCHFRFLQH